MWLVLLSACLVNHDLYEERKALLSDADGDGVTPLDGDCDDGDRTVSPGAVETCNEVDDDCDGVVDEEASDGFVVYEDSDGDGWGDPATEATACVLGAGQTTRIGDCDDGSAAVHPDAEEICDNGVDDDCDGAATGCGLTGTATAADAELAFQLSLSSGIHAMKGMRAVEVVDDASRGPGLVLGLDDPEGVWMLPLGHGEGDVEEVGASAAPPGGAFGPLRVSEFSVVAELGGSFFDGLAVLSRDEAEQDWLHVYDLLPDGAEVPRVSHAVGGQAFLSGAGDLDGDGAAELFVYSEAANQWTVLGGESLLEGGDVVHEVMAEDLTVLIGDVVPGGIAMSGADGLGRFVGIAFEGAPGGGSEDALVFAFDELGTSQDLTDADATVRSGAGGHLLGLSASPPAAVDIDGDGHQDLVISSYADSRLAPVAGSVAVLRGPLQDAESWDPAWELRGEIPYGAVGTGAAPGDFDRDGIPAIAVGWLDDTLAASAGAVGLWHPLEGGDSIDDIDDVVLGDTALQVASVPRAADVDGDGADDLIVIAGGDGDTVPGAIYLHMGGGF